ncbi:peptide chain release factor N(5)-glutamine methyltransferase [Legionella cincinnatiensis]|uniref:Release factor glutamine methyltransferase n=1 Tax=Legionella cincinnatiensis TaxID=28085 RepID=A0A378IPM5_9GAMM|nr:peptide chain release factor N(5)-glutamine methyltransferase [Legionella cincinnatiensis]KTC84300.1 methyltransferase HemK [Legionella cincinnatiensis]STX33974.1 methyltransferase HemK [Legionella cincinnatiensis]
MISIHTVLKQNPEREAEILLGHVLNKTRAYLFAHPEVLLTPQQLATFEHLMAQRAQGMPIAYLTGQREFWSLNLKVNEHTLIPRHETELLVALALEFIPNLPDTYILELGTGSGAIALALAKERPNWQIVACDISQEALKVAKENAQNHKIKNINFFQSDWFNGIPQYQYHAIVANPPYIAEDDLHVQQGDLRFEPRNALVSSQEGLADLQCIIEHGYEYLLPQGMLLLEHGFDQKFKVQAILNKLGYRNIKCWQDIQGHDRVSGGWR